MVEILYVMVDIQSNRGLSTLDEYTEALEFLIGNDDEQMIGSIFWVLINNVLNLWSKLIYSRRNGTVHIPSNLIKSKPLIHQQVSMNVGESKDLIIVLICLPS